MDVLAPPRARRRRFASVVLATVPLALVVTGAPVGAATSADWSQSRGGAAHRGFNAGETTLTKGNVARLQPRFSVAVATDPIEGVVAGGRLFTVTTQVDDPSTVIRAFDAKTGVKLWARSYGGPNPTEPAVVGNRLYMLLGTKLRALDVATGNEVWTLGVGPCVTGPVAVDSSIITVADDAGCPDFLGGAVNFYRTSDGDQVDQGCLGDPDALNVAGPTMRNGVAYFTSNDTEACRNGGPLATWRGSAFIGANPTLPVATSNRIVGAGRNTLRVSDNSGFKVWEAAPTASEIDWRQPHDLAVDNSRIYLAFTAKSGARKLVAFNLATGARLWSRTSKASGAPAVANGVVFVAEGTDGVAAYDAANGNPLWRRAGVANSAPPSIANGRLYVGWKASGPASEPAPLTMFAL